MAASAALLVTTGCGGGESSVPATAPVRTDGPASISRSGALIDEPTFQAALAALFHPRGLSAGYAFGASDSIVYDLAPIVGQVFEHHYPSGSQIASFALPVAGTTGITATLKAP